MTSQEPCDSSFEHPLGSWLVCEIMGPHRLCRAKEPNGRAHTWPNPNPEKPSIEGVDSRSGS